MPKGVEKNSPEDVFTFEGRWRNVDRMQEADATFYRSHIAPIFGKYAKVGPSGRIIEEKGYPLPTGSYLDVCSDCRMFKWTGSSFVSHMQDAYVGCKECKRDLPGAANRTSWIFLQDCVQSGGHYATLLSALDGQLVCPKTTLPPGKGHGENIPRGDYQQLCTRCFVWKPSTGWPAPSHGKTRLVCEDCRTPPGSSDSPFSVRDVSAPLDFCESEHFELIDSKLECVEEDDK